MRNIRVPLLIGLGAVCASIVVTTASAAVDVDAAKKFARRNHCFKCHSVDRKEKDGPTYKSVAEKYRGKADAENVLLTHLSSGAKVKLRDGHEEEHRILENRNTKEIDNLIKWILSL